MRQFILKTSWLGLILMLSTSVGCTSWMKREDELPPPGPPPTSTPKPEDLVRYLNQESAKLGSIESRDLSISTRIQGKWVPELNGWMVCDKPKNFRLMAKKFGPQIDFGSNDQEFWFWVKEGPPYLFHCSHQDFDRGVEMPFPFQPDWVLEALGMAMYDPNQRYTIQPDAANRTFSLVQETELQGKSVQKITVFNDVYVAPPKPQVIRHEVRDLQGQVISSATVSEVSSAIDPGTGQRIIYPKVVKLTWPAEELSMEITLDEVVLNQGINQSRAAGLFSRPNMNGIRAYDLAQRPTGQPSSHTRPATYTYRGSNGR